MELELDGANGGRDSAPREEQVVTRPRRSGRGWSGDWVSAARVARSRGGSVRAELHHRQWRRDDRRWGMTSGTPLSVREAVGPTWKWERGESWWAVTERRRPWRPAGLGCPRGERAAGPGGRRGVETGAGSARIWPRERKRGFIFFQIL